MATPGHDEDTWMSGTLGTSGNPVSGVYDYKYAFILGGKAFPHDAWMFSPGVTMKALQEYRVDFFTHMPAVYGTDEPQILEVYVCSAQNTDAVVEKLGQWEENTEAWDLKKQKFTPKTDGVYHIAFRSLSPANTDATLIDYLKVHTGNEPAFYGDAALDMGQTDTRKGAISQSYKMTNIGKDTLTVSFDTCSPEIKVEGLPLSLKGGYQSASIDITFEPKEAGDYEGFITLNTNDPLYPKLTIKVRALVKEAVITGYTFEDFEMGGPEGWELCIGSVNTSAYGGYNSTRAWSGKSFYQFNEECADGIGFTTHYVNLGENPIFSFWYELADLDAPAGEPTGKPVPADEVSIRVLVTTDNGNSWDTAYVAEPGREHQHNPITGYQKISCDLSKFADETCRIRLLFKQTLDISEYMTKFFRVMVDDVSIGTPRATDLKIPFLSGSATLEKNNEYTFFTQISNLGTQTASTYQVDLIDLSDTTVLAQATARTISAADTVNISFKYTPTQTGALHLAAMISYREDEEPRDSVIRFSYPLHAIVLPENNAVIAINQGEQLQSMFYPLNFYAEEAASQFIYYANELNISNGQINSLSFSSAMAESYFSDLVSLYVAETDQENFDDEKLIDPTRFTKVFEGKLYFEGGKEDFVVPFDQAYSYKGGNLVVMTQRLGKEFIFGKYFHVRASQNAYRSVNASSRQPGTLVEGNYANATKSAVYPEVRINLVKSPAGSISGKVVDAQNAPIQEVRVQINGTQRWTLTANDGSFNFAEVAPGEIALTVSKHGYYDKTTEARQVTVNNQTTYNITLEDIPLYTLKGILRTASGQPIDRAFITVKGYDDFSTYSKTDGSYEISGIRGKTGTDYRLFITADYYQNMAAKITVTENLTRDFEMKDKVLPVQNVLATAQGEAIVSWDKPMPEFAHDAGVLADAFGFSHGSQWVVFGSVFRQKARINQVRWYIKSGMPHANFNVTIFGLDDEGKPDAEKILYNARNVDFVEDAWSVHNLTQPLEADGFMVAIGCDGHMNIGFSLPTEDHPYEYGQCYYAGDNYLLTFTELSYSAEGHLMIRAYGDHLGEFHGGQNFEPVITRPTPNYAVYRIAADAQNEEDWVSIGTVQTEIFSDNTLVEQPKGIYRYAVKAIYGKNESLAAFSNPINSENLAIKPQKPQAQNILSYLTQNRQLHIATPSAVKKLVVYTSTGAIYHSYQPVDE
ncbi:MAG: carboxypeptidase regulatory-like domain-containing protein, partial [Bacteroidales bacterium]|nr:carboxypeptidase regulatory-like domain-containing protein [Bacteroidales bacterium]